MIIRDPKVDHRPAQAYAGLRASLAMSELTTFIPASIDALFAWLAHQAMPPAGAPFLRFHTIDMPGLLDVELGVPVSDPVTGDARITPGMLPAGRYVSLIYRDVSKGIESNRALLDWARDHGHTVDSSPGPMGESFSCRYERFLTGPADDPDLAQWDTEVAMRIRD